MLKAQWVFKAGLWAR